MKIDVARFKALGFNDQQATSLAWAEVFESRMAEIEYKYQGYVDGSIRMDTYCADCDQGGQFLPDTVRTFINEHKGHKTRTFKCR